MNVNEIAQKHEMDDELTVPGLLTMFVNEEHPYILDEFDEYVGEFAARIKAEMEAEVF